MSNPVGYGDKTDQLVNQLKSLNEQMQENLSESLLRGEKIEIVQQRSDSLMKTSSGYLATSRAVKRQQQCRRYKMIAAVICAVIVSNPQLLIFGLDLDFDCLVFHLWNHFLAVQEQQLRTNIFAL